MKTVLIALALLSVAPLAAQAQPFPPGPPPGDPYWRHEGEWRRREEIRDEEARRIEWRREHCVRDYGGHEFCRR